MTSARCWLRAALLSATLSLTGLFFTADRPAHAQDASIENGGEVATVAKTSTKRSSRRSRRPAARRSAATPAKPTEIPIPRPRPESQTAAAPAVQPEAPTVEPAPAAPATTTPEAPRPARTMPVLPKEPGAARAELRALYAVNALSYRCNFELTTREGAVLDRAVTALETQLKLDTQAADALFSDVDLTLYGKGGDKICQKGGAEAKAFRTTLDRLLRE